MKKSMPVGKHLSDTQVGGKFGASGVLKQSGKTLERGKRYDPPMGLEQPGKGLSSTQTRNSPSTVKQS